MRHHWLLAAFAWAALMSSAVNAQDFKAPWEEFDKRLKASQSVGALNDELFGDSVSLPEGSLSFSATDVDLPGNDGLRVSFSRKYSVYNRWKYPSPDFALGDWDLDVPNISGIFAPNWTIGNAADGRRCSLNGLPTLPSDTDATYGVSDFWHGNTLHIPGVVSGELLSLRPGDPKPSTGETYLWTTSDRTTRVSCLDGDIQNGTGEGFLVTTADGTRYWFDWMAQYGEPKLGEPGPSHPPIWTRRKNVLYATRVQDRFGNTVTYTYTNSWNSRAKLTAITGSDGRQITIDYNGSKISAVHANGRTWTYAYNGESLREVVLPDTSRWTISFAALTNAYIEYPVGSQMEPARNCWENVQPAKNYLDEPVGTITHPSGAVGTFRMGIRQHGRSNVPIACENVVVTGSGPPGSGGIEDNDTNDDINAVGISYDSLTLLKKTISGPNLQSRDWNYSYDADISWKLPPLPATREWPVCYPWSASCLEPYCVSDSCAGTARTEITGPGGDWVRYTYGNSYNYNEGKLLKVERGSDANHILRIETNRYDLSLTDQAYPATAGGSGRGPHEGFATIYTRPLIGKTISQQGEAFEWNVTTGCPIGSHCFDEFARPLEVVKSSTLGYSKTDTTEYYDDYSLWVLGQAALTTTEGIQTSRTEFIHKALPWKMYGAGDKLLRRIGYYTAGDSDGLISSINDGNGNKTRISGWKRGVPQSIQYPATIDQPDAVGQLIDVDDNGWIQSVTDENGYKTSYGYDVMGRLTSITYPAGDIPASTATAQAFAQSTQPKYGLPVGHWRQTVHTGNGYKIIYLDAMWRPVVEESYDSDNMAGTRSIVVKRYDASGRLAFQSYPVRSLDSYTDATLKGVRTYYDALDRVTRVEQDSELGVLTTTKTYESGFKTRVVDPRGNATTTSFMAYDRPMTDWPVAIVYPEGVHTDIGRDVFGKPTSITRGNADGTINLTRDYAYNEAQELCASVEPETGTTKYRYDGAGNLIETISGMPVSLPATCGSTVALGDLPTGDGNPPSMAASVHRTYDARNRLKFVDFPDHRGDTTYTYTADGLLESVAVNNDGGSSQIVTTTYGYNHRRLLTSERMDWNAIAWTLETGYDANGHVAWHSYPSGDVVDYVPNALGQPTQVGNYVTGVSYYPNGAIEQFTYGNGIVHTLQQNARGLADTSTDAYGTTKFLSDGYDYDRNGNVLGITDGATGRNQRGNRDMTYDGLDRLTGVTSQMFGDASYSYDALDNLTRVEVTGGNAVRDYDYCYDGNWRLTNVKIGGCNGSTVMGLGYDAQGNLQNRNGVNFDFDYGNRLRSVQGVASYAYDGHGRRVRDLVGASKYSLYSMAGQLMYTSDDRKKLDTSYFYLGGSLVAKVDRANVPPLEIPSLTVPATSSTGAFAASWSEVDAAERYELQQRNDGGSWSRIYNGINRSHSVSGLVAGTYDYRVRACNAAGCGGFSGIKQTVVTMPPGNPPTLTVPAADNNGAFTASWTGVATSTGYHLRQRKDGGSWSDIYEGGALSKAVSGLTDGTYDYQVKACNDGGCSAYSAIKSTVVTFPPTGAPGLTVPAADNNGAFTVSWTSVSRAGRYELQQRKDGGSWGVAQNSTALSKAVSGLGDGSYDYRVRACNDGGCAGFSAIKTAVVTYPPTGVPALTVPATDNNGAFVVSWTSVSAATRYELQQRKDGGSWSVTYNSSGLGKTTSGLSNGSYEYRVRACNAGGCAAFSAIKTAVVTHPPANPPTLTAPATDNNGAFTVSWTGVSTATNYRLEQRKDSGAWSHIYTGTGLSKAVSGLANGAYGYRVRACNTGGCSAYSASKTTAVTHPPAAPSVTAPAADNNGAFTVSWTSVSTSASYRLEQRKNSGAWGQIYSGTALSKAVSGLGNGTYGYRVRACNTGGCSGYSAVRNTVVTFPPGSAPGLSAPGGLINSHEQPSYTVSWSTVATASRYELERKSGASWEPEYSGSGTSKSFMIYRTNGFASYRVRACNAGGCGPYSATKSVSWEDMGGCDPETRICDDPRLVEPGEEI